LWHLWGEEKIVGKPKGKKLHRRPKHRWDDNSKTDLKEIALDIVVCVHLPYDGEKWWAVVDTAVNFPIA